MKRKGFIKRSPVSAGSTTAGKGMGRASETAAGELGGDYHSKNPARLQQRTYGKTDVKLSVIGFGGIVVDSAKQQHANRVVAEPLNPIFPNRREL